MWVLLGGTLLCKKVNVLVGEGAKEFVEVGCNKVRLEELLQGVSAFRGEEQGGESN